MPETFGENRTSPDDHARYFLMRSTANIIKVKPSI
jgi:hypothetical protein